MLHSSSGPGHQILSLRIEGSTPSCSTRGSKEPLFCCILVECDQWVVITTSFCHLR